MVNRMLEKAIEIEGLLRIIRDGKPTPEVYELLCNKSAELSEDISRLSELDSDSQEATEKINDEGQQKEETTAAAPEQEEAGLPEEEDDILLTLEDEEEEANENQANEKDASKPEVTTANKTLQRQTKLRSAFSLNDRFLYSRELFDGNMKMFDSTLDFIEGIEDYSIIEDYFYSELEWDPDNSHVATFMEILRPRFKE